MCGMLWICVDNCVGPERTPKKLWKRILGATGRGVFIASTRRGGGERNASDPAVGGFEDAGLVEAVR